MYVVLVVVVQETKQYSTSCFRRNGSLTWMFCQESKWTLHLTGIVNLLKRDNRVKYTISYVEDDDNDKKLYVVFLHSVVEYILCILQILLLQKGKIYIRKFQIMVWRLKGCELNIKWMEFKKYTSRSVKKICVNKKHIYS